MENKNLEREDNSTRQSQSEPSFDFEVDIEGDDDEEEQVLEIKSYPVTPTPIPPRCYPLTRQLSEIAEEVRSREAIRKSQENVISQLQIELQEAKETSAQQESQLKEAAAIMLDQQRALYIANNETEKLKKELKNEKWRRMTALAKLSKAREFVKNMNGVITNLNGESGDYNQVALIHNNGQSGYYGELELQLKSLSSTVQSKLENWEEMQKERKCELVKTNKNLEVIMDFISSGTLHSRVVKKGKLEVKKSPAKAKRPAKSSKVLNKLKWTAFSKNENSHSNGKHFRDITKRHQGFLCVCGVKCVSRKALDSHIQRFGFHYTEYDCESFGLEDNDDDEDHKDVKPVLAAEMKLFGDKHGMDPTNPLMCLCGLKSRNARSLKKHVYRKRIGNNIPCKFCGKRFREAWDLTKHYGTSHMTNRPKRIRGIGCRICGSTFRDRATCAKHRRMTHALTSTRVTRQTSNYKRRTVKIVCD